ncbi:nucleotidyl transferase AbiEii/AbiGii toxin family protein [Candidatus Gottesmanbacteria bacterium]|nr:nucleotidyl transferase AbiEii/AbiGii toxin family protein [Candidatus Gottesmanbacteria bacterium]
MILVRPEDLIHKVWLLRLLTEIIDSDYLSQNLYFKGGTAASMLGFLDRFSVDLDFDLKKGGNKERIRKQFYQIFKKIDLKIYYENPKNLLFSLKYSANKDQRNTIRLSITDELYKNNIYIPKYLPEIDRIVNCQTIETMFAHKMVAVIDRFAKYKAVAGRDIYDIHHFLISGYNYSKDIIEERTNFSLKDFLQKLISFIEKYLTQTIINQDLNTLLPQDIFQKIRKRLKTETLMLLKQELKKYE